MKRRTLSVGLGLALLGVGMLLAPQAGAERMNTLSGLGKAAKSSNMRGLRVKTGGLDRSRSIRSSVGGSAAREFGRVLSRGASSSPSRGSGSFNGEQLGQLGSLLGKGLMNGGYGDYRGGWGDYHHREDEMAKAYREVGIANAVVALVGVLAQTSQARAYATAQPAMVQAPVENPWVRERVLVSPPRLETTQVWIPEVYDPRTGAKIGGGYHETRTQVIPEVYEEREVRVVSPAVR